MGAFSRFSDIINANINSVLDKAEDPEKIIRLIIGEMEETLIEIRANVAGYLADKKSFERQAQRLSRQAHNWATKAELALNKGREDLARAALVEKQTIDNDLNQLTADIAKLDEILAVLQQDSVRLQQKMAEAKARQKTFYSRQNSATTQLKIRQQINSIDIDKAMAKFDRYERRIEDLEAQVEAYDFTSAPLLSEQFRQLENEGKVDAALAELKKKVANGQ